MLTRGVMLTRFATAYPVLAVVIGPVGPVWIAFPRIVLAIPPVALALAFLRGPARYLFLTPLIALVLAHFWLGEPISPTEAIGVAIVLGGTIVVNRDGGPASGHPAVGSAPAR